MFQHTENTSLKLFIIVQISQFQNPSQLILQTTIKSNDCYRRVSQILIKLFKFTTSTLYYV